MVRNDLGWIVLSETPLRRRLSILFDLLFMFGPMVFICAKAWGEGESGPLTALVVAPFIAFPTVGLNKLCLVITRRTIGRWIVGPLPPRQSGRLTLRTPHQETPTISTIATPSLDARSWDPIGRGEPKETNTRWVPFAVGIDTEDPCKRPLN